MVTTPAHEFERATSIFFAGEGWEAQRDDADYKLFVRRNKNLDVGTLGCLFIIGIIPGLLYLLLGGRSGQTIVTFEIYPVMDGTRVRMTQSRGDRSADRFMRELPGMENRPGDELLPFGDDRPVIDAPYAEHPVLSDEEALERRFDPRYDPEERMPHGESRNQLRDGGRFDPYRDTRSWAGYPTEEAFRRDWSDSRSPDSGDADWPDEVWPDGYGPHHGGSAADRARRGGREPKPRRDRGRKDDR